MVASLTNVTGGMARLLLSMAVLCFNGPRMIDPVGWTRPATAEHADTRPDSGRKAGFHATLTVGEGKRQVTVRLEIGRAQERAEEEGL